MKKIIFMLCLLSTSTFVFAQISNIWYFGSMGGLDFNGDSVSVITGHISGNGHDQEGTATFCDNSGSLQLYSNGETIWRGDNTVFPNGDTILGGRSATHSSVFVPLPNRDTIVLLVTVDDFIGTTIFDSVEYGPLELGARYCLLNLCGNQGEGEMLEKNVLIAELVAEKIAVVRHGNGVDYWVMLHEMYSANFIALLVTSQGIEDMVVSSAGTPHGDIGDHYSSNQAIGQMKFSQSGNMLALAVGNRPVPFVEVFDFDNMTGLVSGPIHNFEITDEDTSFAAAVYGIEFSPNERFLYITNTMNANYLFQVDLTSIDPWLDKYIVSATAHMGLQVGSDGRIYVANIENIDHISVITYPDMLGDSCAFILDAIELAGDAVNVFTFPTVIAGVHMINLEQSCLGQVSHAPIQDDSSEVFSIQGRFICAHTDIYITLVSMLGSTHEFYMRSGQSYDMSQFGVSSGLYVLRCYDQKRYVSKIIFL